MVGDGRSGGDHMFDVIIVLQIRCDGGGDDAALRMPDQCDRLIGFDAGLLQGLLDHACAVRLHTLLAVGAHKLNVLRPSERGVRLAVGAGNGDEP